MSTGIISCSGAKLPITAPAWLLYSRSARFSLMYELAMSEVDNLYIFSALHGIIKPDKVLAPYEFGPRDLTEGMMRKRAKQYKKVFAKTGSVVEYGFGPKYRKIAKEGLGKKHKLRFPQGTHLFKQYKIAARKRKKRLFGNRNWPLNCVLAFVEEHDSVSFNKLKSFLREKGYGTDAQRQQISKARTCPLLAVSFSAIYREYEEV